MQFRLPKPLHGWRAFVGEVGIIVLGVLIALGAQQIVEAANTRSEAAKSMHAIRVELAHSAGAFEERAFTQSCLDRRLDELVQIFGAARRTGRLPNVGHISHPPIRPIPTSAWAWAGANKTSAQFDPKVRDELSRIYSQGSDFWKDVIEEQEMWATMRLLENAPGPIDSAMLAEIGGTLERLRFRSALNGIDAEQLLGYIRKQGIQPDYVIPNDDRNINDRDLMVATIRSWSLCRPLQVNAERRL